MSEPSISLDAVKTLGQRKDWASIDGMVSSVQDFDSILASCIAEVEAGLSLKQRLKHDTKLNALQCVAKALIKFDRTERILSLLKYTRQNSSASRSRGALSVLDMDTVAEMCGCLMRRSTTDALSSSRDAQLRTVAPLKDAIATPPRNASFSTSLREQSSDRFDPQHVPLGEVELAQQLVQWMAAYEHEHKPSLSHYSQDRSHHDTDPLVNIVESERIYEDILSRQRQALQVMQQHWPEAQQDFHRFVRMQLFLLDGHYQRQGEAGFLSGAVALESFRFICAEVGLEEGVTFLKTLNETSEWGPDRVIAVAVV